MKELLKKLINYRQNHENNEIGTRDILTTIESN